MMDYISLERRLSSWLALDRRPVAVAVRDTAPPGIEPFAGIEPSSCSYWRLAAEGRTFYTVAGDHYNCPIGSSRTTSQCQTIGRRSSIRCSAT